jgi:5-methylcytosine-specific restriction enzyme A
VADGRDLIQRIGKLQPARRPAGQPLHRPLLLLWAIAQAMHGRPREQPWSVVKEAVGPLLTAFAGAADGPRDVVYPFWALQGIGLWEVAESGDLPLTSQGRRPKLSALDEANPLAGLPKPDYDRLVEDSTLAAWAVSTLLVRFFPTESASLVEALELQKLMPGELADHLQPRPDDRYPHRGTIADAFGGNRVLGITPLADGILTVYSDDKGPYADQRIPETGWIAYIGDGLKGNQTLAGGNGSMAEYQKQQRALRYWHKPYKSDWRFESWAVIVERCRRWGLGEDQKRRQEYVWILAPVPSPIRETWPPEVIEALEQDAGQSHDDLLDLTPFEAGTAPQSVAVSPQERYQQLTEAAGRTAAHRTRRSRPTQVERCLRSRAARDAVILRSEGKCENPSCLGHSPERTDTGEPILEVDHVNGLAITGQDTPEVMIALCPNCHALKTRGKNRRELQETLQDVASSRHRSFLTSS